jgi:undecaprenyl diphosphate synthase
VEAETAEFNKLVVNLALNYGARDELVMAAREFARDVLEGKYRPEHLTQELFACYLYTRALPEPDLLIRTSGECRISNFLLWQLAYTEIYFTNILWPDFREAHFYEALHDYQRRERRFGKTGEQVKLGK